MNIKKLVANPLYFSSKTAPDKPVRLTIEQVEIRKVNESDRAVLLFKGEQRDCKLTGRQAATLARAWGEETEEWHGKTVELARDVDEGVKITPVNSEAS